jgi:hypothetical protein
MYKEAIEAEYDGITSFSSGVCMKILTASSGFNETF